MQIGPTRIEPEFAEAFRMRYARLIVTAQDDYWCDAAARAFCGYGTSIIGCDCETGVECLLPADETPDGRPGLCILAFAFSVDDLAAAVGNRTGQSLMTCPTTAVYDGLPQATARVPLGKRLRFFGDGYQKSKQVAGHRYWRVPVMDGEFVAEETVGVEKGVAGGNILIEAVDLATGLAAARRAVAAVAPLPGVITPFPGGVARSGSKVGSRYKALRASTSDAYCPTLRGRVPSKLDPRTTHVLEIVIDGVDERAVGQAMAAAARAAAGEGVPVITAGNYGGKLGKFLLDLHKLISESS